MLTLLKTKLAALIQTKVGVAVVAAALVAAGGGAVAMAATHGGTPGAGSSLAHTTATGGHGDSTKTTDSDTGNANRLSVEGVLKAYTPAAGSAAGSISVTDQHSTSYSIGVNAKTEVNGVHANSLNDLKSAVGHNVQVQATKQSGKWVASKVTVEEASGSQGDDQGEGQEGAELTGHITSVNPSGLSFMVADEHGTTKVVVNGSTHFVGVSGLNGLHVGAGVLVTGSKQSDGSVQASVVASMAHEGGDQGTPTPDATRTE